MSTTTTRNSLVKPGYSDAADIAVINTNYDTIDASFAKCNWAGAADPAVSDDGTKGYSIGSLWFNTTGHKLFVAETVGTGSATWRQLYPQTTSGVLLADGSVALTGNWTTNTKNITTTGTLTGNTLVASIADGGASPFTITSKTVTTNLNADMLDGLHDTSFVKQTLADAKGDLLVASGSDAWAREAVSATDSLCLMTDASATNGVSWQPVYGGVCQNFLTNGDFIVCQVGSGFQFTSTSTPANNDDTYLIDQWILLSDGNDIADVWHQSATSPTATGYGSCLLDIETANKKCGIFQIIPNRNCYPLIGGVVSLQFSVFSQAAYDVANCMAAVVAWNSTGDTVTSDIVSSWEAAGTAPTLVANWTYENVPTQLPITNDAWNTFKIENIAIDTASTTNIGVFIWIDDTDCTVTDRLYISAVQLNKGPVCLPYSPPTYSQALLDCQRYYLVSNAEAAAYQHFGVGVAYDTQYVYCNHMHHPRWFKTSAVTTGSAATTISSTPSGGTIETISGENRIVHTVWKFGDDGKGFTANHAYIVLDAGAGTGRVYTESRL